MVYIPYNILCLKPKSIGIVSNALLIYKKKKYVMTDEYNNNEGSIEHFLNVYHGRL
jgi:hypothetical protein